MHPKLELYDRLNLSWSKQAFLYHGIVGILFFIADLCAINVDFEFNGFANPTWN